MGNITLDWNKYLDISARAAAEGIVMLKNDNNALPLRDNENVAIFGRNQLNYYKSGTGSGGLVNVTRVVGITDGLIESGRVNVSERLLDTYKAWVEENPFDIGSGWGGEPWAQKEMPLDEALVREISAGNDKAIVIIGRTAGEEQDSKNEKGAYLLSDEEERMLCLVRRYFKTVIVLLNVGGIINMDFVSKYSPDSVLYVWQGGMVGGVGTASVLLGDISPCGKLPDTVALSAGDYPSHKNFGDPDRNFYCEDIYVGYRYFETFAKERVLYPFGFGMSYTTSEIWCFAIDASEKRVIFDVRVTNTGNFKGKEVVQIYASCPQGKLGKPARVLCGFEKTRELMPGESEVLKITVNMADIASFDDTGVTGHKSAFVLEEGDYDFYVGADVRCAKKSATSTLHSLIVVSELSDALVPVMSFERMVNKNGEPCFETVEGAEPAEYKRIEARMPQNAEYTGDKGIKLGDVYNGKNTLDEFIAQLSDNDLACLIRGEGMCSPKVTAGTASAFGGVSKALSDFGIPCCCCSDGPSGMRFDSGAKAFSIPNGTLLAATFNKELLTELFVFMGLEMRANNVDCLLGPGMNIHRYVLNGRNFEYFSEDPFLTGKMAAAELKGMTSVGVTGTVKHFCANNQEYRRHNTDSVISQRALREIYLKGFEIAVKEGKATTIMTTYGSVNGLWTASSYDLTTTVLRDEWGFEGIAMTDWWASINRRGCAVDKSDFAAMARAQNDIYMVCADGESHGDNTLASLQSGDLTRGELVRNAGNICTFILTTHAMKRLMNEDERVEIINREDSGDSSVSGESELFELDKKRVIPLEHICTDRGRDHHFTLDVKVFGNYRITVTASSEASELAQMPVTICRQGTPGAVLTFNGTNGKDVSLSADLTLLSRYLPIRLIFGQSGLKIRSIEFELLSRSDALSYNDE